MIPGKCSITPDFLEHQGRKLFYLNLEPADASLRGSVLFLPPFADEMHRSRRVVAGQARLFVDAGYRVMLLDLSGCGDSGGDFADATWSRWVEDAQFAARTLTNQGIGPLTIWGLRMGALLACVLSQSYSNIQRLLLWQPVLNGELQVDQFLRLRTVPSPLNGEPNFDRKSLWNELRGGRTLDIAGYELSSALAMDMSKARLNDLRPQAPVHWLEIGLASNSTLAAGSEKVIAHWREQGTQVETGYVVGDPFWRTVGADVNVELQRCTMQAFTPS